MSKKRKNKKKQSFLGNSLPHRYRTHPFQLTRYMTDIDNVARQKKKKTPRALRHPPN